MTMSTTRGNFIPPEEWIQRWRRYKYQGIPEEMVKTLVDAYAENFHLYIGCKSREDFINSWLDSFSRLKTE